MKVASKLSLVFLLIFSSFSSFAFQPSWCFGVRQIPGGKPLFVMTNSCELGNTWTIKVTVAYEDRDGKQQEVVDLVLKPKDQESQQGTFEKLVKAEWYDVDGAVQ